MERHRQTAFAGSNRIPTPRLIERYHVLALVGGAAAGAASAAFEPAGPVRVAGIAATLVAGTVAAVVASLAILGSLLSDDFLDRMRTLGRHPHDFMGPLVVTGVLGAVAGAALLVVGAVPASAPAWARIPVAGIAAGTTVATVISLIPDLVVLNRLVGARAGVADQGEG